VVDESTNLPVANCFITIAGKTVCTGADGTYEVANVKAGSCELVAAACGYERSTRPVSIVSYERDAATGDVVSRGRSLAEIRLARNATAAGIARAVSGAIYMAQQHDGMSLETMSTQQLSDYVYSGNDVDRSPLRGELATLLCTSRLLAADADPEASALDIIDGTLQLVRQGEDATAAAWGTLIDVICAGREPPWVLPRLFYPGPPTT
jgi:hypothetical protein